MVPYPCGGKRVDTFRRVGRIFGVYECTFRLHLDVHINVYMSFWNWLCMYIWIWICIYMSHMRFDDEFWPNCTKSCIDTLTPLSRRLCQRPTRSIEGRCGKDPIFCRQVLHDMMTCKNCWNLLSIIENSIQPKCWCDWWKFQLDLCNRDLTSSKNIFVFDCLLVYLYIVIFGLIWYALV